MHDPQRSRRVLRSGSSLHSLSMATLTLKNVPDDLHRRLKSRAERSHRTFNREAIRCIEETVAQSAPSAPDEALARTDALRERLAAEGVWMTADDVWRSIDEGRP